MSVEVLDGATVRDFVEDESSFNGSIEDCFALLDANKDGVLSYEEMVKEIESFRLLDTHFGVDEIKTPPEDIERVYGSIFEKFDRDGSGEVDLVEFREETKEMLLAVANGLGFLPVQMVLEEGSLLKMAVDRESAKLSSS